MNKIVIVIIHEINLTYIKAVETAKVMEAAEMHTKSLKDPEPTVQLLYCLEKLTTCYPGHDTILCFILFELLFPGNLHGILSLI